MSDTAMRECRDMAESVRALSSVTAAMGLKLFSSFLVPVGAACLTLVGIANHRFTRGGKGGYNEGAVVAP